MTTPTIRVELATTTTGPFQATPTWTTLPSVDVFSFSMSEGRQSVTDDSTQPSTCTITFDNSARLYDPTHTSGTYYASLKPGRQMRVTVIEADLTEHVVFRGVVGVDGWQQVEYQHPAVSRAVVNCVDYLGFLARWSADLPPFESYLRKLAVDAGIYGGSTQYILHWPLDDSDTDSFFWRQTFNAPVAPDIVYTKSPAIGYLPSAVTIPIEVQPSALHSAEDMRGALSGSLDGGVGAVSCDISGAASMGSSTLTGYTASTIGFAVRLRSFPTTNTARLVAGNDTEAGIGFYVDRDGGLSACWDKGTTYVTSSVDLTLGQTYFIVGTYDDATDDARLYVDGVEVGSNTAYPSLGAVAGCTMLHVGRFTATPTCPNANFVDLFSMRAVLTATQVETLHNLWRGFKSLKPGDAAAQLLDSLGISNNCAGGRVAVAEQGSSATPSSVLQSLEQTELGRLYYRHRTQQFEMVTFDDLATTTRHTVSQFTLSDTAADTGAGFLRYSAPNLVNLPAGNAVEASNGLGSWVRRDETSVAAYGVSTVSRALVSDVELDPLSVAEWALLLDSVPATAVASVTARPTSATESGVALDSNLFDLCTIKRKPHNVGATVSTLAIVEGREIVIGDGVQDWAVTFFLREYDAYPWWLWGTGEFEATEGVGDRNGKRLSA